MKKIFKNMTLFKTLTITLAVGIFMAVLTSKSNVKADSYVYDFWKNVIPSTEGITYKETYYAKNIKNAYNPNETLNEFRHLADMEVYENNIYVLDQNSETSETTDIHLANGVVYKALNVSYVAVLNQNFQYEKVVNQFLLSDYAKNKLDKFYNFNTKLEDITEEQASSKEFVDVYDIETASATSKNNRIYFSDITDYLTKKDQTIYSVNYITYTGEYGGSDYSEITNVSKKDIEVVKLTKLTVSTTEVTLDEAIDALNKIGCKVVDSTSDSSSFTITVDEQNKDKAKQAIQSLKENLEISVTTDGYFDVSDAPKTSGNEKVRFEVTYKYLKLAACAPYLPYYDSETGTVDTTKAAVYLNNARGITATEDSIYIADTDNARILKLNKDFVVEDVYLTPSDSSFYQILDTAYETEYGTAYEIISDQHSSLYTKITDKQVFYPIKVAVNNSGVCYCIASNIYEGLVEFGTNKTFNRFLGKNEVSANALKQLWSKIFTDTQLSSLALSLPPMFNNIAIASNGFLYATSNPETDATNPKNMVKIINTKGNDITKRNGYVAPDGDAVYVIASNVNGAVLGSSVLTAVAISKTGNYTVADQTRGRLFTYDSEGNLLYLTGAQPGGLSSKGSGNSLYNSITQPVAIDYLYRTNVLGEEEETIIVLDQASSSIILFETTEFGKAVNQATYLYQNGVITDTYLVDEKNNYVTVSKDGKLAIIDDANNILTDVSLSSINLTTSEKEYTFTDPSGNVLGTLSKGSEEQKVLIAYGAESYWRQVIKMNTNYELAYLGIGKALNRRGEYKEAMRYFKLAHSATYYSKAFSSYRDAILNENFNLIMTVVVVAVIALVVSKVTKKINSKNKLGKKGEDE